MNENKVTEDLLRSHGLRKTRIRVEMLEHFKQQHTALSAKNLVDKMKADHDRVTIYRALNSFEENGIIHKASEDSNGAKYALCGHECTDEQHADIHPHFVCNNCQKTYCLDDVTIPQVKVSDEYKVLGVEYTINGICKDCQ